MRDVATLLDKEYLQSLQDAFWQYGLCAVPFGYGGKPLLASKNTPSLFTYLETTSKGAEQLRRRNSKAFSVGCLPSAEEFFCDISGFFSVILPMQYEGTVLAVWEIGVMRLTDTPPEQLAYCMEECGLSPEEGLIKWRESPLLEKEWMQSVKKIVQIWMQPLQKLATENLRLRLEKWEGERRCAELKNTLDIYQTFSEMANFGVCMADFYTGELILSNRYFLEACDLVKAVGGGVQTFFQCPRENLLDAEGKAAGRYTWEHRDEKQNRYFSVTNRAVPISDGRTARLVTLYDITDTKQNEREMENIAYFDRKLGVPNAQKLYQDIKEYSSAKSHLICFDIRSMRSINDVYGRTSGDFLLEEIKKSIFRIMGKDDMLYRVGGDEFVLFLRESGEENALMLANLLWQLFNHQWRIDYDDIHHDIYARVSLGLVPCEGEITYDGLFSAIEQVLRESRQKNRFQIHNNVLATDTRRRHRLEEQLKNDIYDGMRGFVVEYQPIADVRKGNWAGVEALCRWTTPNFGVVPPSYFIPMAERLGLIEMVDGWILRTAVEMVKKLSLDEIRDFTLHVNLSPLELNSQNLLKRVKDVLAEFSYPPKKLSLEITESAEVSFDEYNIAQLTRIKETGVSLALDDFGAGYSSLSELKNLPVSRLKTDRSFLKNLDTDVYQQHILKTIIEIAGIAGITVIAEGVETKTQMEILKEKGVRLMQGYYFSRPLSTAELVKHIERF